MADSHILTAGGAPEPPSWFVQRLKDFDSGLRIVWGLGQGLPWAGWTIERRIPEHLKAKVYKDDGKDPNRPRYMQQEIIDERGIKSYREYDLRPDWWPVWNVVGPDGQATMEVGEFVLDYLRRNYTRTLMGFPELSMKHWREDHADEPQREEARRQKRLDEATQEVMDHKYDIFSDTMAFGGQPKRVEEGTEL
jgi:hypothetical protein